MVLPDEDLVARTCKHSSRDPETGEPTVTSFEFRSDDANGRWIDAYLSVNWLECLLPGPDLTSKVAALEKYLKDEPPPERMKLSAKAVVAVLPVGAIHQALLEPSGTELECKHEPHTAGDMSDPHSGIYPTPGVEEWPIGEDGPVHLAVQQYLLRTVIWWGRS